MSAPLTRRRLAWLQAVLAAYAAALPAVLLGLGRLGGPRAPAAAQWPSPLLALPLPPWWACPFRWPAHLDFRSAAGHAPRD